MRRLLKTIDGGSVTTPYGFRAAGVCAGIKSKPGARDLAIIHSDSRAAAGAVFTTNRVAAAPVGVSREHLQDGRAQAIVANAGNANACTGKEGVRAARRMAEVVGAGLDIPAADVLVASTGVIGVPLPMEKVESGIDAAIRQLAAGHAGLDAALAIMTTDTVRKSLSVELEVSRGTVRIGGMAKGSGMIAPNMATMLSFITTDADVAPSVLQSYIADSAARTFNMVTVDGDTSTNDTVFVLANGLSGAGRLEGADLEAFRQALDHVALQLAKMIARDGEGATKFVTVGVSGARDADDAKRVAMSVANSSLVKTAVFGADPNWGRIACAAGYSGADLDPERLSVAIGPIDLMRGGMPIPFDHAAAHEYLKSGEIEIRVDLGLGCVGAEAYTCDFSYDYVRINAEYTT